ncbi:MAG: AraC family transcriptional regulator [Bacteroidetes bacterium CG18_big_fil_WC_8_21_14_2_50_41_14]|nr:MAG: AraC family transcriptional regulator [Bacteroidetes bacterium CG18_big_fil_WC_8_21_14_2_50_41_14]PIY31098.1 MAG: AraC family transcriptional regulator [Bacteroidetes bacterium CG_4_10_14_3_um_filter_42_6]PJB55397.1 MAG: AraC family transcriptional regulator [Bacteroidetes bacterium CG_4_9_14_3_um_filter_41_19]
MEKIKKDNFKLVGIKLENKTTNENNQSGLDCGNLWQKFETEKIFDLIPDKLSNEIYAVYYDYEKDETKPFSYFIGCMVDEKAIPPGELNELFVPSQNYVKVIAKGVMTGCITEAWEKIWNSNTNRKFGFDFEVYNERSQDWNDAELDIFVSTIK